MASPKAQTSVKQPPLGPTKIADVLFGELVDPNISDLPPSKSLFAPLNIPDRNVATSAPNLVTPEDFRRAFVLGRSGPPSSQAGLGLPERVRSTSIPDSPPKDEKERSARKERWLEFLKNPKVRAGMLQMGVSLLSGQGFGRSIGQGAEAIGRVAAIEEEERARREALAARGSGGGASGKSATAEDLTDLQKKWAKIIETASTNLLSEGPLKGLGPVAQDDLAKYMAVNESLINRGLSSATLQEAMDNYLSNPTVAWLLVRALEQGTFTLQEEPAEKTESPTQLDLGTEAPSKSPKKSGVLKGQKAIQRVLQERTEALESLERDRDALLRAKGLK